MGRPRKEDTEDAPKVDKTTVKPMHPRVLTEADRQTENVAECLKTLVDLVDSIESGLKSDGKISAQVMPTATKIDMYIKRLNMERAAK